MSKAFPHANEVMHPVENFAIGGRTINLYAVDGRTPSAPYSLYWNDERNPVQHAMTAHEVFNQLHQLLDEHKAA